MANQLKQLNEIDNEANADLEAFATGKLSFEEAWERAIARKQRKAAGWLAFRREYQKAMAEFQQQVEEAAR